MVYIVCFTYAKQDKNNHIRKRYIVDSIDKEAAITKASKVNSRVGSGFHLDKIKAKEYVTNIL